MIFIYQWLNETAPILAITTKESEDPVLIQVGIRGHLIEVNKRLVDNPKLLLENSEGAGYLAIVLPKANELENPLTSEHKLDQDRIEADLLTDEDAGSFFLVNRRFIILIFAHMKAGLSLRRIGLLCKVNRQL